MNEPKPVRFARKNERKKLHKSLKMKIKGGEVMSKYYDKIKDRLI